MPSKRGQQQRSRERDAAVVLDQVLRPLLGRVVSASLLLISGGGRRPPRSVWSSLRRPKALLLVAASGLLRGVGLRPPRQPALASSGRRPASRVRGAGSASACEGGLLLEELSPASFRPTARTGPWTASRIGPMKQKATSGPRCGRHARLDRPEQDVQGRVKQRKASRRGAARISVCPSSPYWASSPASVSRFSPADAGLDEDGDDEQQTHTAK